MDKNSTKYTFIFALIVCVICSFLLSFVSEMLRDKRELNEALDIKKNILKAVSLREPVDAKATPEELLKVYSDKIEEIVIDGEGNKVEGEVATEVERAIKESQNNIVPASGKDARFPLYIYKEGDEVVAYCIPIIGKGLWSTLYGYFAIEPDAKTVRGVTFYKHGETPGLGAEIEKDWFLDNYKGKSIWDVDKSNLFPVIVKKGKVIESVQSEKDHYVDGISGATMTSNGVTAMVDVWLNAYEVFFSKIRK